MTERRNATRGNLAASQGAATERALTVAKPVVDGKHLVSIAHREATTSSVTVAEVFHKRHDRVLVAIRNILVDLPKTNAPFFRAVDYVDAKGEKRPMYEMNRDGFSLLAMGFTGKRALEFKLSFIAAFNAMEATLLNQRNLSWQEERAAGKIGRRDLTDVVQRFVQYATLQGSKSAKMYYMQITMMTNQALFMVKATGPQSFRDTLDTMQLSFLAVAEHMIRQTFDDGMNAGMPYRDIYQVSRQKVLALASALPRQRRISA